MPGGNSQSSGCSSISGVDASGPENKVPSDAVSKDGGKSAAASFVPGSSVAGSSNSSYLPTAGKEKRKRSIFSLEKRKHSSSVEKRSATFCDLWAKLLAGLLRALQFISTKGTKPEGNFYLPPTGEKKRKNKSKGSTRMPVGYNAKILKVDAVEKENLLLTSIVISCPIDAVANRDGRRNSMV